MITFDDFEKIDIRTGTIVGVDVFKEAKKPAYKLQIDFGDIGILKSSAQITTNYSADQLLNKQIVAVVNFPSKQIANFISECLVLGVVNPAGDVVLLQTERTVANGIKIS